MSDASSSNSISNSSIASAIAQTIQSLSDYELGMQYDDDGDANQALQYFYKVRPDDYCYLFVVKFV